MIFGCLTGRGEQENDSKTARAEKKATDEIKLREQKEKEIQDLQFQASDFLHKVRSHASELVLEPGCWPLYTQINFCLHRVNLTEK